jgi:ABC-type polysaccharide/polyol phosphate transport system ATPase subunit
VTAILRAEGIGKRYRTGRERPLADLLRRTPANWKWALRDVDLHVDPGEIVAVIGRNGAGKSTMLKVAAGVTQPSEGSITRPSKIAPLIEVGAGFHPELTGRENVVVNGQLLGLTPREVDAAFDDIVAFAELEHAIDQPVRQYSSGMFMRLGFSVAIHTRPELLIVDEVLAVGDLPFQVRCLDRIRDLREGGVGVLFVSHNLTAVLNLADRAVLLVGGRKHSEGEVATIVGEYHDLLATAPSEGRIGEDVPPTNELVIDELVVRAPEGPAPALWFPGDAAVVEVRLRATSPTPEGVFGFRVMKEGAGMVANWRVEDGPFVPALDTGEAVTVQLGVHLNLAEGAYVMDIAVARRDWTALMAGSNGDIRFGIGVRKGGAGIADLAPRFGIASEAAG